MIPDHIFNKHGDHEVEINENPINKKGKPSSHLATLRCKTCNTHLKFLSGQELVALGRISQEELDQYRKIRRENISQQG